MDEDYVGVLQVTKIEEFVRMFLRGTQIEGSPNTDFEEEHEDSYKTLHAQDGGEMNASEVSEFMRKLM